MQAHPPAAVMELHLGYLQDNFSHHHHHLAHHHHSSSIMMAGPTQFETVGSMGIYEPNHQISAWIDSYKAADSSQNTSASTVVETDVKPDNGLGDSLPGQLRSLKRKFDQEANKPADKATRRLAQNREAARRSRLRKKAYVQQLESSRVKLAQLEQELDQTRQVQRVGGGHSLEPSMLGTSISVSSGVTAFDMEYGNWVAVQNQLLRNLRTALQEHTSEEQLRILVKSEMNHYNKLFRMKEAAAKADVFYLMSGMWKTAAERFFLWIGGFRPSELLKVLTPHLECLDEKQQMGVHKLQLSSEQGEHALSQGMDMFRQRLAGSLASDPLDSSGMVNYMGQMANALGNLESLAVLIKEADNMRQQALQQMDNILTPRQAAQGFLALGDHFQRLRALSTLWDARSRQHARGREM